MIDQNTGSENDHASQVLPRAWSGGEGRDRWALRVNRRNEWALKWLDLLEVLESTLEPMPFSLGTF